MPISFFRLRPQAGSNSGCFALPRRTLIALGLGFACVATALASLHPAANSVLAAPDETTASYWLSERKRHAPSTDAIRQQQAQQQYAQQQAPRPSELSQIMDLMPWRRVVTITPRALEPAPLFYQPGSASNSFNAEQKPAVRKTAALSEAPKPRPRALCVRLCDGSYFPMPGTGAGTQEDCNLACPRAPTRLYKTSNGDISTAVSAATGASYFALPVAMRFAKTLDQTCSCGSSDPMATILRDATLRRGDRVMTADGFRVFKGGAKPPYSPRNFDSVAQALHLPRSERAILRSMERAAGVRLGAGRRDAFAALTPNLQIGRVTTSQ